MAHAPQPADARRRAPAIGPGNQREQACHTQERQRPKRQRAETASGNGPQKRGAPLGVPGATGDKALEWRRNAGAVPTGTGGGVGG